MRTGRMIVVGLAALALGMGGCKSRMAEENKLLHTENQQLRDQLNERNAALDSAYDDLRDRDMQLAESQTALVAPDAAMLDTGPTGFEGIEGVTGSVGQGQITAIVEGDVLFDSGKTTLKRDAKASLDAVASVLKSTYAGKDVQIAGHTDSDPIKKSGFESNYHLGFARAYAVREYLVTRGVDGNRLFVASFGPDEPRATKALSRRVEIAVAMD